MPIIPLEEKVVDLTTDLGVVVRVSRLYLWVEFTAEDGGVVRRLAMYDSGAPWSVLPHTLWHDNKIAWQPLGSQLLRDGKPDPSALNWLGVACQLGEVQATLVDKATDNRSGKLRLVAKFPSAKIPSNSEKEAILGQDFLRANFLTLTLRAGRSGLDGVILAD